MSELEMIGFIALFWVAGSFMLLANPLSELSTLFGYLSFVNPWTIVVGYFYPSAGLTWISLAAGASMGSLSLITLYILSLKPLKQNKVV